MEWQVFVVALKDREGKAIGAHKVSNGRFYMTVADALDALADLDNDVAPSFGVFSATLDIHPPSAE